MSRHQPSSPEFNKEDFPFYWLARVYGVYTLEMERALKPIGLDIPTWRTLFILQQQGASSMSEISLHAVTKLSTVTKTVYRMKAEGLVDTATSDEDARVTMVKLTTLGVEAIERGRLATQHIFRRSFDGLTPTQITRLNESLHQILDNLSPLHSGMAAGRAPGREAAVGGG